MPSKRAGAATASMVQDLSIGTIVGICVGSATLLIALVSITIALLRESKKHKRQEKNHRRLLLDLEQRGLDINRRPSTRQMQSVSIPTPRNVLTRNKFVPFGAPSGWNSLDSKEDVSTGVAPNRAPLESDAKVQKNRRRSGRMAWPFSKRASANVEFALNNLDPARLSAIMESPAVVPVRYSGHESQSRLQQVTNAVTSPPQSRHESNPRQVVAAQDNSSSAPFASASLEDITASLKPQPLAVLKKKKRRNRAQTMVGPIRPVHLSTPERERRNSNRNVYSHGRSFSLGSQNPGTVPHAPMPPLPLHIVSIKTADRPKSWTDVNVSRLSVSSVESIGSSLIAASPRVQTTSSAWLKYAPKHEYTHTMITGPRPLKRNPSVGTRSELSPQNNLQSLQGSISSNPDRLSVLSLGHADRIPLSQDKSTDTFLGPNQVSPDPKIATAETMQFRRVSVLPAAGSSSSLQVLRTPRRQSRFSVTPNGSPGQRRVSTMVPSGPTRQLSQTSSTASSTRSSNGNPFQWDPSPMASGKPSSMKGSPNSRNRGHRRQNCVRISLSPQILGPAGKSLSPVMADIQEESPETILKDMPPAGLRFATSRALPPQPSSSTFAPELKLNPTTLRASLTPSSPTLSMVQFRSESSSQEQSNPSSFASSPNPKWTQRHSKATSILTIPSFPSPGKTVLTTNVHPTPTFSFSRPSNEFDESTPPPAEFTRLAKPIAPDSPPADVMLQTDDADRSMYQSPLFMPPPIVWEDAAEDDAQGGFSNPIPRPTTPRQLFTPQSWTAPPAYKEVVIPISPPCSPKSQSPSLNPNLVLESSRFVSETSPTASGSPAMILDNNVMESDIEGSSTHVPISTPGEQPVITRLHPNDHSADAIRRSVARLRRMNSDAKHDSSHDGMKSAKRYLRLGRESSPALGQGSRSSSWTSTMAPFAAVEKHDSMASLCEVDRMLEGTLDELEEMDEGDAQLVPLRLYREREGSDGDKMNGCPDADSEHRNGFNEHGTNESHTWKRESTVWEDGEGFWERRLRAVEVGSDGDISPLPLNLTTSAQNRGGQVALPQRVSQMRKSAYTMKSSVGVSNSSTPEVKVQPPSSDRGTPGSMYDENGFLKT